MFAPYNGIPRCSGRCLHRPAPQAGARPSGPMTSIGPYNKDVEEFRPRRGQSGKREKSVKKNAALLHFLGFFPLTLLFGVLRGERLAAKTMAASLLRKPARAVIRPAGANIARSPVSRAQLWPLARNPAIPQAGPPALSEVAGPFSVPFGVPKGTPNGQKPLKKGDTARWCLPPAASAA